MKRNGWLNSASSVGVMVGASLVATGTPARSARAASRLLSEDSLPYQSPPPPYLRRAMENAAREPAGVAAPANPRSAAVPVTKVTRMTRIRTAQLRMGRIGCMYGFTPGPRPGSLGQCDFDDAVGATTMGTRR